MHFAENNLLLNYLLTTDSYKVTHWDDYPEGTRTIESYFECRNGALFKQFPFYGLQGILKDNFVGPVLTQDMIDQAADIFKVHFGNDAVFNRKGWLTLLERYQGRLPLRIRALPEGTVIRPGVMRATPRRPRKEAATYRLSSASNAMPCGRPSPR